MSVKRAAGAVSIVVGTVIMWRVGLLMNQSQVLSAEDTQPTLETRVVSLEKRMSNLESVSFADKATAMPKKTGTKEAFLRLVDGAAAGGDWVKIPSSDFWFQENLYGNVSSVTWEGYLEIKDGNGIAYARLFDVTNNRGVDGSEISISSGIKSSFFSPALAIWRGQNQYRVEVKSNTGYEVAISQARLRIKYN